MIQREIRRSIELEPFICQECEKKSRKGYRFFLPSVLVDSFHICDKCLDDSRSKYVNSL